MTLDQELELARSKELELLGKGKQQGVSFSSGTALLNKRNFIRAGAGLGILLAAILGIKTCTCVCSSTVNGVSEVISKKNKYVPKGFEGVHLGMSYEELQEVRPFVKTGDEISEAYEMVKDNDDFTGTDFNNYRTFFGYEPELPNKSDIMDLTVTYRFYDNELQEITFTATGWKGSNDLRGDLCPGAYGKLETLATGKEHSYDALREIETEQTWSAGDINISFACLDGRFEIMKYSLTGR
ncbi:MAG: hypothetical protein ABIG93_03800 [archaeon]|nr:hypothetical protein [Nanoarchaeota archaeon]